MKEQHKKLGAREIEVRIWTLKDKDSLFRAKEPDQHCVEIIAHRVKGGSVMIRDFWFTKPAEAKAHFDHLKTLF